MTIRELLEVCATSVDMFMYDKNTCQNIQILANDPQPSTSKLFTPLS